MENTIRYIKGIKGNVCNEALIKSLSVEGMLDLIKNTSEYYEVITEANTHHRLYLDIDTNPPKGISKEDFDELDQKIKDRIVEKFEGQKIALATASGTGKDGNPKISWRVYFPTLMTDRETNRQYAVQLKKLFEDIPDTKVDTSCYGKNQKMRMLNQNKNEKEQDFRPIRLVQGEMVDTLITYVPEGTERFVLPDTKEEAKKKREIAKKQKIEEQELEKKIKVEAQELENKLKVQAQEREKIIKANQTLFNYLNMLTPERIDDYESWIKLGFILFDKDIPLDVWIELSKKGEKFVEGECEKKWESFSKRSDSEEKVGLSTIVKWVEEDTPELFEKTYFGMKKKFEETHFKTMFPIGYHRVFHHENGKVELQKFISIGEMYQNMYVENGKSFVGEWVKDPNIRTYQGFGFYPKPSKCPSNIYNLFTGFEVEKMEITDTSATLNRVFHHMKTLVGNDEASFEYFLRYIAHMFQFPEIKPGVAIIFNGGHGTGKDLFLGFIERLLGYENYVSTGSPEEVVFSRFNAGIASKILVHIEEMSRNLFKKYAEKVKTRITKPTEKFEEKGEKAITLDCYERYIFTTNDEIPIYLEEGERRMVIFTPSRENCGNHDYFNALVEELENPSVCRLFYNHLMGIDLTNWKIRVRQLTKTYDETIVLSAPPPARLFNDMCIENRELNCEFAIDDLVDKLKRYSQYEYKSAALGRELKQFRQFGAVLLIHKKNGQRYRIIKDKMVNYLKSKKWWYDPGDELFEQEEQLRASLD